MVLPREQLLGAITILDEDSTGFVTANDAELQNVSGVNHTARAASPGGDPITGAGKGALWIETGTPTTPKFTDSAGTTITLGGNSSDLLLNDSTISGVTISDALETLSSSLSVGAETLAETLELGNSTDGYDIIISNSEIRSLDDAGTSDSIVIRGGGGGTTGGNVQLISGAGTTPGSISLTTGNGSSNGGSINLSTGTGTTGGDVNVITSSSVNIAGNFNVLLGGVSAPTSNGSLYLRASDRIVGSMTTGGDGYIIAGDSTTAGTGAGGKILLQAGSIPVSGSGQGGSIDINAGLGRGGGLGGGIQLIAGNTDGTSAGGLVNIYAGNVTSGTGTGGAVRIEGGDNTALGTGGSITIKSGDGSTSDGDVDIIAGTGSITLNAGEALIWPSADGTSGQVMVTDGAGNLSFANADTPVIDADFSTTDATQTGIGTITITDGAITRVRVILSVVDGYGSRAVLEEIHYYERYGGSSATQLGTPETIKIIDEIGIGGLVYGSATNDIDLDFVGLAATNLDVRCQVWTYEISD